MTLPTRIVALVIGARALLGCSCSSDENGAAPGPGNATGGQPPLAGAGGLSVAGSSGTAGAGGAAGAAGGGPVAPVTMAVTRLRSEYRLNPLGIDVARPRLDWLLESTIRGQRQTAYQILVSGTAEALAADDGDLWDSGKVSADDSAQIEYDGTPLMSRQRAWWKVRVWDKDDLPSPWSEAAWWEAGLLDPADWQAQWIAAPGPTNLQRQGVHWLWYDEGDPLVSAPAGDRYFRRAFDVPAGAIERAILSVAADNAVELFVNGTRVGAETDWTQSATFNISAELATGNNVLAVRASNVDGPAGLALALDVVQASGTLSVLSDVGVKASGSAAGDWTLAGFDDSGWPAARELTDFGQSPWTGAGGNTPVYLRTEFAPARTVIRARLYATALGIYEPWLNGKRVGVDILSPGWTDYRERVQVQTYDVTSDLIAGDNAFGVIVADGWYNGKVGFKGRGDWFGAGPNQVLAQLELEYDDGTREVIATGGDAPSWKAGGGPILTADLLNGETYDARLESAWSEASFDDASWPAAEVIGAASAQPLVADVTPGVQITEELPAISVNEVAPGVLIYDLGQNMVGWARLRVTGSSGSTLKLRFAEVLNDDGTLYVTNLRGARATDLYTLRGGGEESYEPRFTNHGFRYVELTGDLAGLSAAPSLDTITGIVTHSATPFTSSLVTSSDLVNQLQSNIVWGQRGNFVSVPTDCPQRDERLGWMGDAQVFVHTATLNADVASFYTKWMRDVSDAQADNGAFTEQAPDPTGWNSVPAWGDAGVIVPWTIYRAYGDTRILAEHYDAMAAWVAHIQGANPNYLWQNQRGQDYGDWLSIDADTDKEVLATAFYAHSADLMGRIARVLGRDSDAEAYEALFASITAAFNAEYVTDGVIRSDTQTVYALALRFNLIPEALRAFAVERLASDVLARGNLSTGFIGVGHLLPALTADGRVDVAYQLLTTETFPSWLYSINKGATTIWERWDGIMENGAFQTPSMNSFNHYSFGAVGEWMYGTIGGIELDPLIPGYEHFVLRPQLGGGLDSARAELDTIRGRIVSAWNVAAGAFTYEVSVPVSSTATLFLPFTSDLLESGQPVTLAPDGSIELGSGSYTFAASAP